MPLTRRIEGLLMSADKPLGEGRLANWLGLTGKGREAQVREAIELLNSFYAEHDRAFRIDRLAGGWQLLTHPEISPLLDHVHHEKKRRELSPAQLAIRPNWKLCPLWRGDSRFFGPRSMSCVVWPAKTTSVC